MAEERVVRLPDGRVVALPETQEPMVIEPEVKPDKNADLFEVPQPEDNDINVDHLFETEGMGEVPEEEDLSDLFDSNLDREPEPPKPKPRYRVNPKYRRSTGQEPPSTMSGLR